MAGLGGGQPITDSISGSSLDQELRTDPELEKMHIDYNTLPYCSIVAGKGFSKAFSQNDDDFQIKDNEDNGE